MPVHSIVEPADCPAAEQLLLMIGRAGVLSSRAIRAEELETLLRLLGLPSERQRNDFERGTDITLVEDGTVIYWPRTGAQFHLNAAAYAMARASDARMSTAALKRELALLRSSLAALTPAQPADGGRRSPSALGLKPHRRRVQAKCVRDCLNDIECDEVRGRK